MRYISYSIIFHVEKQFINTIIFSKYISTYVRIFVYVIKINFLYFVMVNMYL